MKITKFADIPQYTRGANYAVNVPWSHLERALEAYNEGCTNLYLDPDFQRGHVWSLDKKIAYVTYILRGGQGSREIKFNHPNWSNSVKGDMVLVDGKQRLEAVRGFLRDEFPIYGSLFSEFTDELRIMRCDFVFKVNDLKTREEVLQWYLDLNSGGVVHTEEELNRVREMLEKEKGN